jgi:CarboxypepD_reg-like domain
LYKFYFYIICLALVPAGAFSQMLFQGKVINEETNEPVNAASVYFNNTSIGTTTNALGEFQITVPALASPQLIVSSIGFSSIIYAVLPGEQSNPGLLFKLKKKQPLLREVLILNDETRKKWLRIFKENFLGITEEANLSSIENQAAIYFTKPGNERNSFNAYSDTPLVIINKKLGYKIYFQLQEFYYDQNSGITSFYGFTRYEEMGDKKRWLTNRRKAYYGSSMHFFRSLINNKLEQEFYKIFIINEDFIAEADGSMKKISMAAPATVEQILKADSVNTGNYFVSSNNKIMVQYNRDPESKAYLKEHVFITGSLPTGFRSYLIPNADTIKIDKNGVLVDPLSVLFTGYWVYEKAANLLPYNYDPEAKK